MRGIDNTEVSGSVNYSETEHVIGTWIDGKTLYEKTVNLGALPNATTKSVAHGISNISMVVQLYGMFQDSNNWFPLPYCNTTAATSQIRLSADRTYIVLLTGANMTQYTGYATIRYTKTA